MIKHNNHLQLLLVGIVRIVGFYGLIKRTLKLPSTVL